MHNESWSVSNEREKHHFDDEAPDQSSAREPLAAQHLEIRFLDMGDGEGAGKTARVIRRLKPRLGYPNGLPLRRSPSAVQIPQRRIQHFIPPRPNTRNRRLHRHIWPQPHALQLSPVRVPHVMTAETD